jgi:hypothetical protein
MRHMKMDEDKRHEKNTDQYERREDSLVHQESFLKRTTQAKERDLETKCKLYLFVCD